MSKYVMSQKILGLLIVLAACGGTEANDVSVTTLIGQELFGQSYSEEQHDFAWTHKWINTAVQVTCWVEAITRESLECRVRDGSLVAAKFDKPLDIEEYLVVKQRMECSVAGTLVLRPSRLMEATPTDPRYQTICARQGICMKLTLSAAKIKGACVEPGDTTVELPGWR